MDTLTTHHWYADKVYIIKGPDVGLDDKLLLIRRKREDNCHALPHAFHNFFRQVGRNLQQPRGQLVCKHSTSNTTPRSPSKLDKANCIRVSVTYAIPIMPPPSWVKVTRDCTTGQYACLGSHTLFGPYRRLRDHLLIVSPLRLDRNNNVLQSSSDAKPEQNLSPHSLSASPFAESDSGETHLKPDEPRTRDVLVVQTVQKSRCHG